MFILILSCLWITFCTRSSTISLHLQGTDEIWCVQSLSQHRSIYFRTPYQSRAIALYPTLTCTERLHTVSFKFSSRAIRAINDCLTPIDYRGRLATLFLQRFDEIIAVLFLRKKFFSHIQLRYVITPPLNPYWHFDLLLECWQNEFPEKKIFSFYIIWKNVSFGLLHVLICLNMFQQVLACFRRGDFLSQS